MTVNSCGLLKGSTKIISKEPEYTKELTTTSDEEYWEEMEAQELADADAEPDDSDSDDNVKEEEPEEMEVQILGEHNQL